MSQIDTTRSNDSRTAEEPRGTRSNLLSHSLLVLTENEAGVDGRFIVVMAIRIGECVKHAQNRVGFWIRFFVVNTVTKKFQTKQTQGELPAGIRGDLGQRVEGRVIGTLGHLGR